MNIWNTIWEYLNKIDVIFGLLAAIFSGFAFSRLQQQKKRLVELAKKTPTMKNFIEAVDFFKGSQTSKPVALALSLTPAVDSIKNSVESYLKSQNMEMDVQEIKMDGINSTEDLENFFELLREKKRVLTAELTTELHLFIMGPVMAGTIAGAMFDNWISVKLYHKPMPQIPEVYEYWMPLMK